MPAFSTSLLTAGAALAGVLGLIWLIQRVLTRAGIVRLANPASRTLGVEERLPIDAKRSLLLVRCGERRLLLLTGGAADAVVGWLP
ncbi:MAG TPA: flagellar biosynthetic protein FliO [Acidisphaera sp.]|nr:flagellar biosynthetic protein FliO [Acidisphaera sp.]